MYVRDGMQEFINLPGLCFFWRILKNAPQRKTCWKEDESARIMFLLFLLTNVERDEHALVITRPPEQMRIVVDDLVLLPPQTG